MGKISLETTSRSPELIRPDAMLGETLVQKELITRQDLYDGLVQQMTSHRSQRLPDFDAEISFPPTSASSRSGLDAEMS